MLTAAKVAFDLHIFNKLLVLVVWGPAETRESLWFQRISLIPLSLGSGSHWCSGTSLIAFILLCRDSCSCWGPGPLDVKLLSTVENPICFSLFRCLVANNSYNVTCTCHLLSSYPVKKNLFITGLQSYRSSHHFSMMPARSQPCNISW